MSLIDAWGQEQLCPDSRTDKIETKTKSYEEVLAEETNIQKVVDFLERLGIQVKTEFGYYRDTYDVLKDISEIMFGDND